MNLTGRQPLVKKKGSIARALPLLVGIAAACESVPAPAVIDWVETDGYRVRALAFQGEDGARFSALSASATGLAAATVVSDDRRLENRTLVHGAVSSSWARCG